MPKPVVGVLALQGDVREHLEMLRGVGAGARSVRTTAELAEVDALVIPGGESTTMYKLANIFELSEPLRERIAAGMPVLGTCAGMIMLADSIKGGIDGQQTLGGLDVVVRRNAFGRQVDSFEGDVDFRPFDEPFHAVFIRAPWVEKVGDGVEVLATLSSRPVPALSESGASAASGASGESGTSSEGLRSTSGARCRESSTNPSGSSGQPSDSPGGPPDGPSSRLPSGSPGGPTAGHSGGASGGQPLRYDRPDAPAGRIVAVRQGAVMATSFHPELTSDDRVHRYFIDLVRSS